MRKLPASVLILAILGIPFGAFIAFSGYASIINVNVGASNLPGSSFLQLANLIGGLFLPLGLILIAGAIGCFRLYLWARRVMMAYAYIAIVHAFVYAITFSLYTIVRTSFDTTAMRYRSISSGILGTVILFTFFTVYPFCVLIFFRRRRVVEVFCAILPTDVSAFPVLPTKEQMSPHQTTR